MRAGRALGLLERGLGKEAFASVHREPMTLPHGGRFGGGGKGRAGSPGMEWTVLVTAPDYEQQHRGRTLADAVAEALAAYHSVHAVHGVDELEFAETSTGAQKAADMSAATAHLPPAA